MVFSSITFLFRFMPIVFLLYYLMPRKAKNLTILLVSLVFYSWGEVRYFPIMIASIVVDYVASRGIERYRARGNEKMCRVCLIFSMVFNLGMLVFFKYTNFIIENINYLFSTSIGTLAIILPLGISFYTFQTMSYTIDVYRGNVEAEHNIIDFGAYVTMFPQLIAGPIVKFTDVNHELKTRKITFGTMQEGVKVFIMGLGSKVLIANSVGALWTQVESMGFDNISTPLAWLGILAFTLQIYFDFSGYSLMAIGLGKMLGFNFPPNFNFPYISKSVTEFWRRWHMTLSSWFREYLYIPLGGNRKGTTRMFINLFIVWFSTGLWHGASWNFVLWGLYFFVLLVIEKVFLLKYLDKSKVFSRIYLLFSVMISWALFAVTDFGKLGQLFSTLFVYQGGTDWMYYLRNYAVVLLLGILFSAPILHWLDKKLVRFEWLKIVFYAGVMIFSVAYLVDASYNPFLYFRF